MLARIAHAEARAHTRYGQPQSFGPLTAVDAGPGSPLSTAWLGGTGLGGSGEGQAVRGEDLAAFEQFCEGHDLKPTLHVLSHAGPELLPLLAERHYSLKSLLHLYAHELEHLPTGSALEIRSEHHPASWASLSAQGFGGGEALMGLVARAENTHLYTAYLDGEPAGTAALSLVDGVAALHGASTLPGQRGRGVQTGLLAYRLYAAKALGAELATVFVTPASASERNIARAGFRLVGMRLTFERG